jgi:type I restriction enzyme S subunit
LEARGLRLPRNYGGLISGLPRDWRVAELGHVLRQLTNGFVGPTRDILVDSGIRYIQSLHIKDGEIDFERGPYFVSPEWHRARPRVNLRCGDVLIVQTGDIGQIAVVPEGFGEASCHALQIARVEPDVLLSGFLGEYLRCGFGRAQLLARATGALHPHLEAGIKSAPVVLPTLKEQDAIVNETVAERGRRSRLRDQIDRAIVLLSEYKRSLITAAVTGELDVTTARRGVPA